MRFEFGFYSSILLIFFFHFIVYSALLFRKSYREQQSSSRWLSFFLLLSALYIAPWMLGFAGWYDNQPYRDFLFYAPLQQLWLIGPVVYFYVRTLLNPAALIQKKDIWHFLPALMYLLYSLIVLIYDKWVYRGYFFLKDELDPDFASWYQVLGFISMFGYFLMTYRYYQAYQKLAVQVFSDAGDRKFLWVRNFLLAFMSILIARIVLFILEQFIDLSYIGTWWYFLSFAISCYYIAIAGYANAIDSKIAYRTDTLPFPKTIYLYREIPEVAGKVDIGFIDLSEQKEDNPGTLLKDDEFTDWRVRADQQMRNNRWYTEPELTLPDLAQKLGTNVSQLSKMINKGFGMNFNDWINGYRIEAFCHKIREGEQHRQTLLSIAFECGFNSKTTFNRAFRKQTGQSPIDFIRQLDKS